MRKLENNQARNLVDVLYSCFARTQKTVVIYSVID